MISTGLLLVVGASGFIGEHIFRNSKQYYSEVVGTYNSNQSNEALFPLDLSEFYSAKLQFLEARNETPQHAIVCSCISQIDLCLQDSQRSALINVENTIRLMDHLHCRGFRIGFLSTDQVFSDREHPYTESDVRSPINLYGMQKSLVENYIIENYDNYSIFRLSKVVAPYRHRMNLFTQWEELIRNNSDIVTIGEQILCPTSVGDVSRVILESLNNNIHGIVHISAEPISRTEMAEKFVKRFPEYSGHVRERRLEEFDFLDARSLQVVLDSSMIQSELNTFFLDSDRIIDQYFNAARTG